MGNKIWDSKSVDWDAIRIKLEVHELSKYSFGKVRKFRKRFKYLKRDFEIIRGVKESICYKIEERIRNSRRQISKNT